MNDAISLKLTPGYVTDLDKPLDYSARPRLLEKIFSESLGLALFASEQMRFVVLPPAGDFLLHFHLPCRGRHGIALTSN